MKFFNKGDINNEQEKTQPMSGSKKGELEFNKKNREDYENLMQKSSTQYDDYWDRRNPLVRMILMGLGAFIIFGSVYYIVTYLGLN